MKILNSSTKPARHRWLQFGLNSLLLLTLIPALAITWWRQWKQSVEIMTLREKLQQVESERDFQYNMFRVLREIDLENKQHRQAFETIQHMDCKWHFESFQQRQIDDLDILLFHHNTAFVNPGGWVGSVAAVLRNDTLIDLIVRSAGVRTESHDIGFRDVDGDGVVEVVFDCRPGRWGTSEPKTIAYQVLQNGHFQIEQSVTSQLNK